MCCTTSASSRLKYLTSKSGCMSYGTAVIDVMGALDWWMNEGAEINKFLSNHDFVALDCYACWHTLCSTQSLNLFYLKTQNVLFNVSVHSPAIISNAGSRSSRRSAMRETSLAKSRSVMRPDQTRLIGRICSDCPFQQPIQMSPEQPCRTSNSISNHGLWIPPVLTGLME